jgi:hypothetical protein
MEEKISSAEERPHPTKCSWRDLGLMLVRAIEKKTGPVLTIRVPILGCMTAAFLSHFSGNGIFWNILHFFCSWFYVSYKSIEYLTTHFN